MAVSVPASITTPDTVQTRLGTLRFHDGAPTAETAERLYDNLGHDLLPAGSGDPEILGQLA